MWESVITGWKKYIYICRYYLQIYREEKGTEMQRTCRWDWNSTWRHPAARSDLTPLLHLYISKPPVKEELNSLDHKIINQEWNETNSSTRTPTHCLPPSYWSKNKKDSSWYRWEQACITVLSEEPRPLLGENRLCKSAGTKLKKLAPPCLKAVGLYFKQHTIKSYRFSF